MRPPSACVHLTPVPRGRVSTQGTHSGVCVPLDTRGRGVRCTWGSVPPLELIPVGTEGVASMEKPISTVPVRMDS